MSWIRKIIIVFIFIIFTIILYRLHTERRALKTKYGIEGFREGFSSASSELGSVKVYDPTVKAFDTTYADMHLNQYCIKGAYNAALTGKYINAEILKYLLFRGCRFLDFEVFSFDSTPYVAMSTDSTYSSIDTTNKDTLQNILAAVANYAFALPSQITKDPVFVHLRIKTGQTNLYNAIGDVIGSILKDKRYIDPSGNILDANGVLNPTDSTGAIMDSSGNVLYSVSNSNTMGTRPAMAVNGNTKLSSLQGTIIVVVDRTYIPNYDKISYLGHYVNMESGGDIMQKYGYGMLMQEAYTTPRIKDDGMTTDVATMKLVMPDIGWRNSEYYPAVLNYGAQVVLYPFYKVDDYLKKYDKAFSESGKAGFVPMSNMITYIQGQLNLGIPPAAATTVSTPSPATTLGPLFGTIDPSTIQLTPAGSIGGGAISLSDIKNTFSGAFSGDMSALKPI